MHTGKEITASYRRALAEQPEPKRLPNTNSKWYRKIVIGANGEPTEVPPAPKTDEEPPAQR